MDLSALLSAAQAATTLDEATAVYKECLDVKQDAATIAQYVHKRMQILTANQADGVKLLGVRAHADPDGSMRAAAVAPVVAVPVPSPVVAQPAPEPEPAPPAAPVPEMVQPVDDPPEVLSAVDAEPPVETEEEAASRIAAAEAVIIAEARELDPSIPEPAAPGPVSNHIDP